jgi:ABC-type multidrug transport system fused ATPase/permease subunit
MRLPSKTLAFLLNLLLGGAWAFVFIGALSALYHYHSFNWFYALASALIWSFPGLFVVVFLEYLLRGFERNEAIREQTRLLKEIREALERTR